MNQSVKKVIIGILALVLIPGSIEAKPIRRSKKNNCVSENGQCELQWSAPSEAVDEKEIPQQEEIQRPTRVQSKWIKFDSHEDEKMRFSLYYDPASVSKNGNIVGVTTQAEMVFKGANMSSSYVLRKIINCRENTIRFVFIETHGQIGDRFYSNKEDVDADERPVALNRNDWMHIFPEKICK